MGNLFVAIQLTCPNDLSHLSGVSWCGLYYPFHSIAARFVEFRPRGEGFRRGSGGPPSSRRVRRNHPRVGSHTKEDTRACELVGGRVTPGRVPRPSKFPRSQFRSACPCLPDPIRPIPPIRPSVLTCPIITLFPPIRFPNESLPPNLNYLLKRSCDI